MRAFSPMDTATEYESSSSEDEDGLEVQPNPSDNDDPAYQQSDSHSSNYVRRTWRTKKHVETHGGPVILKRHQFGANTDLEVGTLMSKGETLELDDGSFLKITSFGETENSQAVKIFGYLLRRIEEFQDYQPVTFDGSELVWLREAKKRDPKPEGYLRSATSKNVLRIRQSILPTSAFASEYIPQSDTATFTDSIFLTCQWTLEAELSDSHVAGAKRSSRSIQKGSQGKPKAFIALSCQEPLIGEVMGVDDSHDQNQIHNGLVKAGSGKVQCQLKKLGKNFGRGKERCKDARRTMLLAPHNDGNRMARVARASARRKSSHHLEMALACMLKSPSPSRELLGRDRVPQAYTFADAFCGAGGVSIGAREAGLHLAWAFDKDGDAVDTYNGNHGECNCERTSAQDFLASGLANKYKASTVDILHHSPPSLEPS